MHLISIDPGFGGTKTAEVRDGKILVYQIPSVVGQGSTDLGHLDLGLGTSRRGRLPRRVSFDGVERLVGPNVAQYTRPVERMDFDRLQNGPELRALIYATLAGLLGPGQHQVQAVIGLPVEVLQGPRAAETIAGLKDWLIGQHNYKVNGRSVSVDVQALRPIAQPVGTYFEWGLDLDGTWPGDRTEELRAPVAVADLGFNTLDLFSVTAGQINRRYTGGDTLGMRRAATALSEELGRAFQRPLSLHEADALLRKFPRSNSRPIHLHVPGGVTDVTAEVRSALDVTAGEVTSFIERTWGNGRQFSHLLLTGGGCLALGARLRRQLGHAVLLRDPVTANARGLARLAVRAGVFV